MSLTRPEPAALQLLVDMGFPEHQAALALIRTYNCGIEPAANWLMEHPDVEEEALAYAQSASRNSREGTAVASSSQASDEPVLGIPSQAQGPLVVHPDGANHHAMLVGVGAECKVVLIVALDLGMSQGKVAAQCAHAAVGLYRILQANRTPWMQAWEDSGEKTVVLACRTSEQLHSLAEAASVLDLPTYMVTDAGRTEIPSGSQTVLAIGGMSEAVDQVSGQLHTLK